LNDVLSVRCTEVLAPTMFFVGVTTGRSFINRLFPVWAEALQLGGVELRGIDLPPNDEPAAYRGVVEFIKGEERALGALVTTHKINVYQHARDLFDGFDPYADLLGEVSSISKRDGKLIGHAKDPITSGLAFEDFAGTSYWCNHPQAEAVVLGSGGSALAFATHLLEQPAGNRPGKIVLTGRTPARLRHLGDRLGPMDGSGVVECRRVSGAEDHDQIVSGRSEGSLVVNATGMGKDRPGSPLTDAARFPMHGLVWEFNYRGELRFLHQAEAQAESRGLTVEDGWCYFLHGWSQVMAEVFHFALDDELFGELRKAADGLRREGES